LRRRRAPVKLLLFSLDYRVVQFIVLTMKAKSFTILGVCAGFALFAAEKPWTIERFLKEKPDVQEVLYASGVPGTTGLTQYVWGVKSGDNFCLVEIIHRPLSLADHELRPVEGAHVRIRGTNYILQVWETNTILTELDSSFGAEAWLHYPFGPNFRFEADFTQDVARVTHPVRTGLNGRWEAATEEIFIRDHVIRKEYQFDYSETILGDMPKKAVSRVVGGTEGYGEMTIVRLVLGQSPIEVFDVLKFMPKRLKWREFEHYKNVGGKTYKYLPGGSVVPRYQDVDTAAAPPRGTYVFWGGTAVAVLGIAVWLCLVRKQNKQKKKG
jgi:hypothetical protein